MDLQHPRGVQVRATKGSVPRYVSDQSYTDRDEAPPLCTGQPAPQSVSPARKNGLPPPSLPPCLRSDWPPAGAPCSICYNKSTILASTRDDSIGRSGWPGPFLRITRLSRFTSRARCTSHRRDVLGMLLSSPGTSAAPLYRPILPTDDHSWLETTVNLPSSKGDGEIPSKRLCSTALLPSSEIELARNGSGSWSRGASRSFFQAYR